MTKDYVKVIKIEESNIISVCFYIEGDKVMAIGDKMNALNECAYMNGYNWEAFLNFYLSKSSSALLEGLNCDSEAGMYAASYELNEANEKKAAQFAEVIEDLVENEDKIYQVVKEFGEEVEWD